MEKSGRVEIKISPRRGGQCLPSRSVEVILGTSRNRTSLVNWVNSARAAYKLLIEPAALVFSGASRLVIQEGRPPLQRPKWDKPIFFQIHISPNLRATHKGKPSVCAESPLELKLMKQVGSSNYEIEGSVLYRKALKTCDEWPQFTPILPHLFWQKMPTLKAIEMNASAHHPPQTLQINTTT